MSATPETLTSKIHNQADRKLRAFLSDKLGDLFDLCGKHNADRVDFDSHPKLAELARSVGLPEKTKNVWHGAVWPFAQELAFEMLKTDWRNRAVAEWMAKVERLAEETAEIKSMIEEGAQQ